MDISKIILLDPINKWVFKSAQKLNTEVYLVGGYMRDLLRGQISKDKDFVLSATGGFACGEKNAVEKIAIETAKKFNGTFIPLKPNQTYRIVLKHKATPTRQGQLREVLDFSSINQSINNDLKKRDFTVNAIAWSLKKGIIDPFGGGRDLKNHIVKSIRIKNLKKDALRTIRAYRLAAELGFRIESRTRKHIKHYSNGLTSVAPERITEELFKMLSYYNSIKYLIECYKDKVLEKIIFPVDIKNAKGLAENVKLLKKFDLFIKTKLQKKNKIHEGKKLTLLLKEEVSQGLNRLGLLRLAILLIDCSISRCRLRVSNNINKAIRDIHNGYKKGVKKISVDELYKIFDASGGRVFEIAIILSFTKLKEIKYFLKKAEEFINVKNKILLNGNDVQKLLNIKPGTKIGEIIAELKKRQFKGLIKTKVEAKRWLLSNFT